LTDLEQLITEGWALVPVLPGTKAPRDSEWSKKTYAPTDFGPGDNVGAKCGLPSGGRVDVDVDSPEAVAAARVLLYETGLIHGRPGKPSSHHWYLCTDAQTETYESLDGEMLIEIRVTGQTVIPPSTHKSGDVLVWEKRGTPLAIGVKELRLSVVTVATTALFAKAWPSGSRHYAAGHLAGFLLRCGFDGATTLKMVEMAARIAGDEEVRDRVQMARDTIKKHEAGEPVTGGPKLRELFGRGDELVKKVYGWLGLTSAAQLDSLNEKHFVAEYGRDTVVGTEVDNDTLIIQDFESFRRRYYNQYVGKQRLGEWWLSHADQRRYRKIVFAPPPAAAHPEDYNTWKGFAVEPDTAPNPELRCVRFLEHLFRIVCDENQTNFEYLLDVCALTCQRPGEPTGVAVVLRGDSGGGKGSFVDNYGSLFGVHYIQVDKQEHITGNFNQHLQNKVLVFADEAMWAGNKQDVGALRTQLSAPYDGDQRMVGVACCPARTARVHPRCREEDMGVEVLL
jgi:hypothetical protein